MTKKASYILLLLLINVAHGANLQQPPTAVIDGDNLVATADPKQHRKDRETWNNIVKGYLGFRQLAKSGLATLESAEEMAFTVNRMYQTVMKIGTTSLIVIENATKVKDFFKWEKDTKWRDKFWNVLESIEFIEEEILQNTDWIVYESREELREEKLRLEGERSRYAASKATTKEAFKEAFVGPVKRSKIYTAAMARRQETKNGNLKSVYANKEGNELQQRQMVSETVANRVTATKDVKQNEIDNNSMITNQLITLQDQEGDAKESQIADANNILQRNVMAQKFQQHSHIKDECDVAAHFLLSKLYEYETRAALTKVQEVSAIELSQGDPND